MAKQHMRSNSLPSNSHPAVNDVEDRLRRLKSSATASTSASSACSDLAYLRNLNDDINNLIHLPSIQQAFFTGNGEKWLDEHLGLVDLCEFARDVVCLTRQSVQDLQSSIRRNGGETSTSEDKNAYMASRKNIYKMVNKFMKKFKTSNKNSTAHDLKTIEGMLTEAEAFGFSVIKSVLVHVSEEKGKSRQRSGFLSKFASKSRVHSEAEHSLEQLIAFEMTLQELEEELESLFRSLVKTRVSLLNILNH